MVYKLLFFLLPALLPLALFGQQTPTSADTAALLIQPIPITEVPTYVESNKQLILRIQRDLVTPDAVKQVKLELPELDSVVQSAMAHFDTVSLELYTLDQLAKSEIDWKRLLEKLNGWNKTITDRVNQLKVGNDGIIAALETWNLTSQSLKEQEVPETILGDIVQSAEELEGVRDSLSTRISYLLTLQSTSSQLVNKISERISTVNSQREELLRNIFIPERPPLWRVPRDSTDFNLAANVKERVVNATSLTKTFFENRPGALYLTPFVLLMILLMLLYYKYWLSSHRKSADLEKSAIDLVLKWPIVSSLLLTWLFVAFFFSDIPIEVRNIIALIMLAPLSVILFGLFNRKPLWVLVFAVFFLFDLVYIALIDNSFTQRMVLLAFTLGTVGILIWLLIVKATSKLVGWAWLVTTVVQIFALVCFGALFANIAGSVQLSELLLLGTTGSILTGISLYAVAYLLVALISMILSLPLFQRSIMIRNYETLLVGRIERILYFIGVLWWADITLVGFRIEKEVYGWIAGIIEVSWEIGSLSLSPGDILAFALTLLVTIWLSRLIRFFLEEEVFQRTHLPKGVPGTITMMIRYGTITLGFLMAIAAAGIEMDKLAIVLGALGVGIGFGLQDIINNLISGIVLALERPVQVGDVIQVDELMGVVKEIGFRASKVRTYDGSEVIVPNGHLVSKQMINWTLSDTKRRLKVDVGVAYGTDPQEVLDLMSAAANEHKEVLKDPAPRPRFIGFGDSALEFQLLYWIPDFDDSFRLGTEMTLAVHNKIGEAGITIPFPQRDMHIKGTPADVEKFLNPDDNRKSGKEGKSKKPSAKTETAQSKEEFDVD